jgi:hypothetical protein
MPNMPPYANSRETIEASGAINTSHIAQSIERFKSDLRVMTPIQVVRRHVIHGGCIAIKDSAYFDLRSEVAEKFGVHPNEVLVVGSGKLGFSIAPAKMYRYFSDASDIDVVIVSRLLFEKIWKSVHEFYSQGGYSDRSVDFKHYLFQGWIRPDKLPTENRFKFSLEWWEFFNRLSASGKYSAFKVRGALYFDWYYLEAYQMKGASACLDHLQAEGFLR